MAVIPSLKLKLSQRTGKNPTISEHAETLTKLKLSQRTGKNPTLIERISEHAETLTI